MATIDVVGKGGLPNLYFERIELAMATSNSTFLYNHELRITFSAFDSKIRSWFDRPEFAKMKVKIVAIHDHDNDEYFKHKELLDTGEASLFDYRSETSEYRTFVFPAPHILVAEGAEMDEFSVIANIEVPAIKDPTVFESGTTTSALSIYAGLFLDDLGFQNEVFNKFYGPTSAEEILAAGEPVLTARFFYFPDSDVEYGGPVHQHDGVWMEGATHTDEPHRELRSVVMANYKLEVEEL